MNSPSHLRRVPSEAPESMQERLSVVVDVAPNSSPVPLGAYLVSTWVCLAPLIFAAVQVDYFLRVPIAIGGSAVIALILSRFRQREWVIHPVTIILSFVVALLLFISQLGV